MNSNQKKPAFDIPERLFHSVHIMNIFLLFLSGIQIHAANINIFGAMHNAITLHYFCAWLFFFLGVWHFYRFFALGKYHTSLPSPLKRSEHLLYSLKYYLFLESEEPVESGGKGYNEMQKLGYSGVFALGFFQFLTGIILYWPVTMLRIGALFGGLQWIRYIHYLVSWAFVIFVMIHLYLIFSKGTKLLLRMLAGK